MMSNPDQYEEMIARAVVGEFSQAEMEAFANACRDDEELHRALCDHHAMERMLAYEAADRNIPEGFTAEILAKLDEAAAISPAFTPRVLGNLSGNSRRRVAWVTAIAACLTVIAGLLMLRVDGETRTIATLTATEAMDDLSVGTTFTEGQRIELGSGFAEIHFRKGAEMILEGPAALRFTGDNSAVLERGSASVHVPEKATGFTLDAPDAEVVDVGTDFAMKVSPGQATEVHVIDGLILASTSDDPSQREMRGNDAIRVVDGSPRSIPARPESFVSSLPKRDGGKIGFLHWSFDNMEGNATANSGPGIGGFRGEARLTSSKSGGAVPQVADGVFGKGIFLDGKEGFVETDFPGIGGSGPRTVAMWVRLPEDWKPKYGYALASWGSYETNGGAWQISVNPGQHGGEVGHPRVGTFEDYAVGGTDLRDGRWHHIAAVTYGGNRQAGLSHLLIYVDGELEITDVKSTTTIQTDISSNAAQKMKMGRNLAEYAAKGHFRGGIDEVVVADEALTRSQIRQLMQDNRIR